MSMPSNIPTSVIDMMPFVPAEDFALSLQFYADLGFQARWANEQMAELRIGSFGFLLQNFYIQQHAGNFVMTLMVEDADPWWRHVETAGFRDKYPDIMMKPPTLMPWGLRVLYLSDPSGVLWHIADRRS
jgi:Glyoxalase/Bleomycin resistance protein/Dioxygenase superfamily